MVTQKQIAQRLGISQPLVAMALKGHSRVGEATRQRVMEVAQELGYDMHSNGQARALSALRHGKKVQTGQIAVLMGDFIEGLPLQDMPFFREILQGIYREVAQNDIDITIHILRKGNLPRLVTSDGVDGVICVYSDTISEDLRDKVSNMPVVRLGQAYQSGEWALFPDNQKGIYQTTAHLLELGHRRVAYLGVERTGRINEVAELRFAGFRQAHQHRGISVYPELVVENLATAVFSSGYKAMKSLLAQTKDFTGVVCSHDSVALGAAQALNEVGFRVPDDVSVTGFDGARGDGYAASNTLTTAYFDRRFMGKRAVEMLKETVSFPAQLPIQEMIPTRLMIRRSTQRVEG